LSLRAFLRLSLADYDYEYYDPVRTISAGAILLDIHPPSPSTFFFSTVRTTEKPKLAATAVVACSFSAAGH
jgi:hypothetical protein